MAAEMAGRPQRKLRAHTGSQAQPKAPPYSKGDDDRHTKTAPQVPTSGSGSGSGSHRKGVGSAEETLPSNTHFGPHQQHTERQKEAPQ